MKHETMPAPVVKLMAGRERVARGLCQGYFRIARPESLGGDLECPVEAVNRDRAVVAYLVAALPTGERLLTLWVDAKGRTLAEILALFDRAIALALQ
jgi:hypothetical protein